MTPGNGLTVREMLLADVGLRINYFHDASDDYLRMLGVERNLLPAPEEWHEFYEEDYARPIQERANLLTNLGTGRRASRVQLRGPDCFR